MSDTLNGNGSDVRDGLRAATDTIKEQADTLGAQARSGLAAARDHLSKAGLEAKQAAYRKGDAYLDQTAQTLVDVGRAMQEAAEHLDQNDQGSVGKIVRSGAGVIDSVGQSLQGQRASEIIRELEDFARKNPWIFVAAAAAIGVALTRFFKSVEPPAKVVSDGSSADYSAGFSSSGIH